MYQAILDRGYVSGVVLYNQGNAFMRAGQRGRAVAAYRQARRYLGPDPFLEANLAYALGNQPPACIARSSSTSSSGRIGSAIPTSSGWRPAAWGSRSCLLAAFLRGPHVPECSQALLAAAALAAGDPVYPRWY